MAMVPIARIDEAWLLIQNEGPPEGNEYFDKTKELKDYYIKQWLENPTIPREVWNHYGNFGRRTINNLEAFHSSLKRRIKTAHPNIFVFISHLKNIQKSNIIEMEKLDNGGNPPRINKRYASLNNRIMNMTRDFEQNLSSLDEYIKHIGYQLFLHD